MMPASKQPASEAPSVHLYEATAGMHEVKTAKSQR